MKPVASLLIIFISGTITLAQAQDESPSPAASPEENSASSMQAPSSLRDTSAPAAESKPSATVETTATPAPSARPSASPQKKAAAATAPAKKEKAAESEESAAPASAGPDKGNPESTVKKLENQWEASVMKHDSAFVESRVAKDFMGVSSKGKRLNKSALLKEYKADTDVYSSARNTGVTVHSFAPNVVVASGTAKEVGKTKDGTAFNRSFLWTDTWVMRGDHWECVASHVMLLSGK